MCTSAERTREEELLLRNQKKKEDPSRIGGAKSGSERERLSSLDGDLVGHGKKVNSNLFWGEPNN